MGDVLDVYVFVGVVLQTTEETRRRHRSDRAQSEGGYVNEEKRTHETTQAGTVAMLGPRSVSADTDCGSLISGMVGASHIHRRCGCEGHVSNG